VQEDVQGVAAAVQEDVSSYQGGHVEYFSYLVERLRERGAGHVKVYGGGGGVIVPEEIATAPRARGGAHLLAGRRPALGLPGMINR
jgi:isobutyryl-CoA mutase